MAHPKNYESVFAMTFVSVYSHYLAKVLKKIAPKKNLIPRYVLFGKDGTILHKDAGHSLLKISTTNSLMNHELKCVLMTRIITIAGIRDIQFR